MVANLSGLALCSANYTSEPNSNKTISNKQSAAMKERSERSSYDACQRQAKHAAASDGLWHRLIDGVSPLILHLTWSYQ
jgi:hypothetical protein